MKDLLISLALLLCCTAPVMAVDKAGKVLGISDTLAEPRFSGGRAPATPEAETELRALLGEVMASRPFADWVSAFEAADVPFAEARWTEQALDDPQLEHNQMVVELGQMGDGPPAGEFTPQGPNGPAGHESGRADDRAGLRLRMIRCVVCKCHSHFRLLVSFAAHRR